MSLDCIFTTLREVRKPACISDYAGDSLAAHRATLTREVLRKVLDKGTPALQVRGWA